MAMVNIIHNISTIPPSFLFKFTPYSYTYSPLHSSLFFLVGFEGGAVNMISESSPAQVADSSRDKSGRKSSDLAEPEPYKGDNELQPGVVHDDVFGDITEDGPNYRSVSLFIWLFL